MSPGVSIGTHRWQLARYLLPVVPIYGISAEDVGHVVAGTTQQLCQGHPERRGSGSRESGTDHQDVLGGHLRTKKEILSQVLVPSVARTLLGLRT